MPQENIEVIRAVFDAFNGRDADSLRELWMTDAEWAPAYLGGGLVEGAVYRGHEGLVRFLELQSETWERIDAEPVETRDLGDCVLVEVLLDAIGRGSGTPVRRTTWNVFEVRDGKVAAGRAYESEEAALEAVGLRE